MATEGSDPPEPAAAASSEESPVTAVVEGAATGSVAGPIGLVGGVVLGWLISRVAKRQRSRG